MKNIGQEQKDFLRTVASLAYGTGFREGSKGGKGHMALLSDGKKLRVIKCNTHFNHASKVQNEIASSTDAQNVRKQLIEGSALLRVKLYGIGRSLGFTDEQLVKSLGSLDNKTTLLTRKAVAGFVNDVRSTLTWTDTSLDDIWTYAENHAVKSDFSMTFEKVAAENATDFGGTVRLNDRERTIRSFKECIKALGLEHTQGKSAPSPTIADLMKKLEGQYPLTYDDEVQLQRLRKFKKGLHDFREPFGKNFLREILREMFDEYDCELKGKMVDEIHSGVVFRKFVKDFLENADPESKTLSESFAAGLRGVLKGLVREAMSKRFNQLAAELNERLGEDVVPTADKLEAYVKKGETDPLPRIYKQLMDYSRYEELGLGWLHAKPNLVLANAVFQVINWPSAKFDKSDISKVAGTIAKSDTFKESLRKLLLDGPSKGLSNFADLVTKWLGGERALKLAKTGLFAVLDDKKPKHPLIRRCVETESPSVNQFKSLMNVYNTLALEDKRSIQEGKEAQNAEILAMIEMYLFGVVETNKGNVALWLNRQNP